MRPPVLVWRKDGERELVHQQERVRLVGSEPLFAEDITVGLIQPTHSSPHQIPISLAEVLRRQLVHHRLGEL